MRLVCHSCGTRFRVPDQLVRGKVVRFRCKHCATILEAHLTTAAPDPAAEQRPLAPTTSSLPPPLPRREWFLSVGGGQVGPLSLPELQQRLRRGEASADDLVWRRGLGMWQPVVAVDELRGALNEAPALRHEGPPPLPAGHTIAASSQVVRLVSTQGGSGELFLPGNQLAAMTPPGLAPTELRRGRVAHYPPPPPPHQARWPVWVALAGGMMMLVSVTILLVVREGQRRRELADERPAPRLRGEVPLIDLPTDEVEPPAPPSTVVKDLPPLEVHQTPRPPPSRGQRLAEIPDHIAAADRIARELGTRPEDLKTAIASRVFSRNKSSLLACDRLSERRGEVLPSGSRAAFRISVTASGAATVEVQSHGLPETLTSCYRAVASQWKFPVTGMAYTTLFSHVH